MKRADKIASELGLNEIVQESIKRHPRFADKRVGFIDGAEWMQRKMIEKACEWLKFNTNWGDEWDDMGRNLNYGMIEEFRKAMEE